MSYQARRSDSQRTAEQILIAADRMLIDDPAVSMQGIATAAGVARTTVHRRFIDRDHVVALVTERAEAAVLAAVTAVDPRATNSEQLHTLTAGLIEAKITWAYGIRRLAEAGIKSAATDRLRDLVEHWQKADLLRADVPITWLLATLLDTLRRAADQVHSGDLRIDEATTLAISVVVDGYGSTHRTRTE